MKQKSNDTPYPFVMETFHSLGFWERRQLLQEAPMCFNGNVTVRRYRIAVEEIPESVEVLGARLQKLWDESNNHHDYEPLATAARKIGYVLHGQHGAGVKERSNGKP